jgi:hypothetical protein
MTLEDAPFRVSVLVMPKAGCPAKECEDSVGVDRVAMRFCVADGATEAFDSRRWARLLTKSWVRRPRPVITAEDFAAWLPAAGDRLEAQWANRQLPWYAEEKSRSGAFAAFAGLTFEMSEGKLHWAAAALGDACVFRRGAAGRMENAIPDLSECGFERRPTLLPSKRALQVRALNEMEFQAGAAEPGDVFLLMTDAIAAWYLNMREHHPERADHFEATLQSGDKLADLVDEERHRAALRNDDVAVIRIACGNLGDTTDSEKRQ